MCKRNCPRILFRVQEICSEGAGAGETAAPEQWLVQGLRAKSKVDAGTRKEVNRSNGGRAMGAKWGSVCERFIIDKLNNTVQVLEASVPIPMNKVQTYYWYSLPEST